MKTLLQKPWIWALFGILALWILLSIGAGRVNLGNLTGILAAAALLCVVAIGQTFVVTTGNGAVDLSIPSVMTLSGFVATSVTNGQDARLPLGILAIACVFPQLLPRWPSDIFWSLRRSYIIGASPHMR